MMQMLRRLEAVPNRGPARRKLASRRLPVGIGLLVLGVVLTAAPDARAQPQVVVGDDGAEMVLVPAGPFMMGTDESRFAKASPSHERDLPAFHIDRYQVTNAQFARYVEATGASPPAQWEGSRPPAGQENHPVTNITWFDAMRYAVWTGKRLPTEAEWEKAARGTDGRRFPWGDVDDAERRNIQVRSMNHLEPVDTRPDDVSPYGAVGMAGNAREWTADWYDAYPGSPARSVHFGRHYKAVRGGAAEYLYAAENTGSTTSRVRLLPYGAHDFIGFRCVRDLDTSNAPYDPAALLREAEGVLSDLDRAPVTLSYEKDYARLLDARRLTLKVVGAPGQTGPVRVGVPFPEGLIDDASRLRLLSPDGHESPSQATTLATWKDGSARWVLLDFAAKEGDSRILDFSGEMRTGEAGEALDIDVSEDRIRIDTGLLAVESTANELLREVRYRNRPAVSGPMTVRMEVETADGPRTLEAMPAGQVELEDAGPMRATMRLRGRMGDEEGRPSSFLYDIRLHATADSSRINLLVTLTHDAPRQEPTDVVAPVIPVRDVSVSLPLDGAATRIRAGTEQEPLRSDGDGRRLELVQHDDLSYVFSRGADTLAEGRRAPGWLAVERPGGWVTLGVRHFWQNHPAGLFVEGGRIGARTWAGSEPFEWEGALAKTHEIVLDFSEAAPDVVHLDPLRATMPPEWACGTRALGGPLLPRSREMLTRFPYWEMLRTVSMQRWVKGMPTGFRDFGDAYMGGPHKGKNAFLNLEYDVPYNFLMQYLRTAEAWYLDAAEAMVRHQADIDTDHVTGQPWKHSPQHTTTRADIAHMFIHGMLLHHLLTGEHRSLDIATKIGDHIAERTLRRDGYGNERQIGWGLFALCGIYEVTGDEKYIEAASSLCDYLAEHQSPTGRFPIRWDNRIAFMNGIAMNGLLSVYDHTGDPRIAASVLRVARRTFGMYPEYALRTLNGYCWALRETGDPQYLHAMERTWDTSMAFLGWRIGGGVEATETHAWWFTDFAARYGLFPLFDQEPDLVPDPATWKGVRLPGETAEVLIRRDDGREPAPVMIVLEGVTTGTVEWFDASGETVSVDTFEAGPRFFGATVLAVPRGRSVHRLRLASFGADAWQVHHDARTALIISDPEFAQVPHLHPRAWGFVHEAADEVKVVLEVEGEGYHTATLYDHQNKLRATARRFVDFQDPGRYRMELSAPVDDGAGEIWSLDIFDAKVVRIEGMSPYWSPDAGDLFHPERIRRARSPHR